MLTPGLVAMNVMVFVAMVASGVHAMSPRIHELIAWGALTAGGEPWRLLTCAFVHVGAVHLALNMWVLWDVGRVVERSIGRVGFAVLSGAAASLSGMASVWWHAPLVSAGASAAGLNSSAVRTRHRICPTSRRSGTPR